MADRVKRARSSVNYASLDKGSSSDDDDFCVKAKVETVKKKKTKRFSTFDSDDDDFAENTDSPPKKKAEKPKRLPLSPKVTQVASTSTSNSNRSERSKRLSREDKLFQKELEKALQASKAEASKSCEERSNVDVTSVACAHDSSDAPRVAVNITKLPKTLPSASQAHVEDCARETPQREESEFRLRINAAEGFVTKVAPIQKTRSVRTSLPEKLDSEKPFESSKPEADSELPSKGQTDDCKGRRGTDEASRAAKAGTRRSKTSAESSSRASREDVVSNPPPPRTPSLTGADSNSARSSLTPLAALSTFAARSGIRVGLSRSVSLKPLFK